MPKFEVGQYVQFLDDHGWIGKIESIDHIGERVVYSFEKPHEATANESALRELPKGERVYEIELNSFYPEMRFHSFSGTTAAKAKAKLIAALKDVGLPYGFADIKSCHLAHRSHKGD